MVGWHSRWGRLCCAMIGFIMASLLSDVALADVVVGPAMPSQTSTSTVTPFRQLIPVGLSVSYEDAQREEAEIAQQAELGNVLHTVLVTEYMPAPTPASVSAPTVERGNKVDREASSADEFACSAEAMQVELTCQSWKDVDSAIKHGTTTAIVPIGGTEQSGPYIAVGKHNIRVQRLADEIAMRLGHTFVAPVLPYVPEGATQPRSSHMRFAGTLSISPAVFGGVVEGIAESLRVQGFETIVLLGDHGGYQAQLAELTEHLNQRWQNEGKARVLYVGQYYDVVVERYEAYLRNKGYGSALGKHADLSDTSLMLAVDPSLVRQSLLGQGGKPDSADGIYGGDPRQATAALGRVGTAMQVQAAVEVISSFNRRHP